MATQALNNAPPSNSLPSVSNERLKAIAYYVVGIGTEGGKTPYTGAADAGGASGLSIGVMQHDFGQHPAKALAYAQAIVQSSKDSGQALVFNAPDLDTALRTNSLTLPMRQALARFGATEQGADWIHNNLDLPHVNAAVDAAKRALDTAYGKAVIAQGTHVEEFVAFAMKVYNQYGNGVEGGDGKIKSPGFGAFLDYLNNQSVVLRDNRHPGKTVTVTAQHPSEFNLEDLLRFSRAYADTRKSPNEGVFTGPKNVLAGGALYRGMLDSVPSIADSVRRLEARGGIAPPSLTATDPDAALLRSISAASPLAARAALLKMKNNGPSVRLPFALGQYPGHLNFDPKSARVAVDFANGHGFNIGAGGYGAFTRSAISKGALSINQADGSMVSYQTAPLSQTFTNPPTQPPNTAPTGVNMTQDANTVTLQTSNGIELKATRASDADNWQLYQSRSDGLMASMGSLPKSLTAEQLRNIAQEGVFNSRATAAKDWNMNNDSSFTPASIPLDFASNAITFTNKKGIPIVAIPLQDGKDGVLIQDAGGNIVTTLRSPPNTPPLTPEVMAQYGKEGLLDGIQPVPAVDQRPLPPSYVPAQAQPPQTVAPQTPTLDPLDAASPSNGNDAWANLASGTRNPVPPNVTAGGAIPNGAAEPLWGPPNEINVKTPNGNTVKLSLSDDDSLYNVRTLDNQLIMNIPAQGKSIEEIGQAIQQGQFGLDDKIQRKDFVEPLWPMPGDKPGNNTVQPDVRFDNPGLGQDGITPSIDLTKPSPPEVRSPALW
jgi:hypothetical protein